MKKFIKEEGRGILVGLGVTIVSLAVYDLLLKDRVQVLKDKMATAIPTPTTTTTTSGTI